MNMAGLHTVPAARVTPGVTSADPAIAFWIGQVNLRLRREICWCWFRRTGGATPADTAPPPIADAAAENLDEVRILADKRRFFAQDATARHLSEQIANLGRVPKGGKPLQGWRWAAAEACLSDAAQFVLALGFAARLDSALGPLFAACMNDSLLNHPTLALAQRLWDDPLAIVPCADRSHPLYRFGLLTAGEPGSVAMNWLRPIEMHAFIVRTLFEPRGALPGGLEPLGDEPARDQDSGGMFLAVQLPVPPRRMEVVPLVGPESADYTAWIRALAKRAGRPALQFKDDLPPRADLLAAAGTCWLRGSDIVMPAEWLSELATHPESLRELHGIPIRWYVPASDARTFSVFPATCRLSPISVPALTHVERRNLLREGLGPRADTMQEAVDDCARRFRLGERDIARITRSLSKLDAVTPALLAAACRSEVPGDLGHLTRRVEPRFSSKQLVLPPAQMRQFDEVRRAMRSLTRVHYDWGTARAWNECGLSVMFCGAPGTGKTMAAEALAMELEMPMHAVDLAQVVNKYIGETEKNLKRIFDAAENMDVILFFDEADALFGKRTEVRDAHDRFANIEISYLLERMERFKGLAVLSTNRRKDLDEAFLRRLRYVIEFPMPGPAERESIWRGVFPEGVNASELDFRYLAKQFQIAGGNIRSIAFNALLQSAACAPGPHETEARKVGMAAVLLAVKRELEKMNRATSAEQFGRYSTLIPELVA